MLHPTMIYGAAGEDNVQRLAALLRRLPVVPLPAGGRALVQPIHQDDVTRAILAALTVAWPAPRALVIAGPAPLPYADFVRAVARAAGLAPPRIVPLPAAALMALAPLTAMLPFLPRITPAEIRRLREDKAFDVAPMSATLGLVPIPLDQGLALTFAR
jgi:nucleoside-diphosphate-sugar epimerase